MGVTSKGGLYRPPLPLLPLRKLEMSLNLGVTHMVATHLGVSSKIRTSVRSEDFGFGALGLGRTLPESDMEPFLA